MKMHTVICCLLILALAALGACGGESDIEEDAAGDDAGAPDDTTLDVTDGEGAPPDLPEELEDDAEPDPIDEPEPDLPPDIATDPADMPPDPDWDIPFDAPGDEITSDFPFDIPFDIPTEIPDWDFDIPFDIDFEIPDIPFDIPFDIGEDRPDVPTDIPSDASCVSEGCLLFAGDRCCDGLVEANECDPASGEPSCLAIYCINCGDGACDPHENCYNCSSDCDNQCHGGIGVSYGCGMLETHQCECNADPCPPECKTHGGSMGWFDSCTGDFIREDADCRGALPVCLNACTRSEGWYEGEDGELIGYDFCTNAWACRIIW